MALRIGQPFRGLYNFSLSFIWFLIVNPLILQNMFWSYHILVSFSTILWLGLLAKASRRLKNAFSSTDPPWRNFLHTYNLSNLKKINTTFEPIRQVISIEMCLIEGIQKHHMGWWDAYQPCCCSILPTDLTTILGIFVDSIFPSLVTFRPLKMKMSHLKLKNLGSGKRTNFDSTK